MPHSQHFVSVCATSSTQPTHPLQVSRIATLEGQRALLVAHLAQAASTHGAVESNNVEFREYLHRADAAVAKARDKLAAGVEFHASHLTLMEALHAATAGVVQGESATLVVVGATECTPPGDARAPPRRANPLPQSPIRPPVQLLPRQQRRSPSCPRARWLAPRCTQP